MTELSSWPPHVVAAYEAGASVSWSTEHGCWLVDGRALSAAPTPLRKPAARCPRCGGRIVPATDIDGTSDDYCLACSHRPGALTPQQAQQEVEEMRISGKQRKRNPTTGGMKL